VFRESCSWRLLGGAETTKMDDEEPKQEGVDGESPEPSEEELPTGIARLHEEWLSEGLIPPETPEKPTIELEPVVFPEPVGDYTVPAEEARARLGLLAEAMERLLASGELDSIFVKFEDGVRRLISESALSRFLADSGMEPALAEKLPGPAGEAATAMDSIRGDVREIKELHSRQLQQFKDILLLELRNLKEQDRDLTSFVYDLTTALEEMFPKLRKRKRTPPPDRDQPDRIEDQG